ADRLTIERHAIAPGAEPFLRTAGVAVTAAPGRHSVATVGLRFQSAAGTAVVYSSDTAPCDPIRELASGADLLIHEATYLEDGRDAAQRQGHSTARQAAETAALAGARSLSLVHFTPR